MVLSSPARINYKDFIPLNRSLQPEGLHPSRGVAASDFRPLRNIPHCCLPYESGPYLSPNVAVHHLRPANHHRLGRPLPHQLANSTQAHPLAIAKTPSFSRRTYAVLTSISRGYSPLKGRFSRVTHPSAAVLIPKNFLARLACVRHAASVYSEP